MAEDFLKDMPREKCFWTCNGVVLHNLSELASYLEGCSDYDFRYHVNVPYSKNDFAIWAREVVGDEILARDLDAIIERKEYLNAVRRRVRELNEAP